MSTRKPASYAELFAVLDALPILCREKRRRDGLSLRGAASQIDGVSFNTISRVENGSSDVGLENAVAILKWVAS